MKILTTSNPKIIKGEKKGYLSVILHLAPSDISGYQVCPYAKLVGCEQVCLNIAGRGGIPLTKGATFKADNGVVLPFNHIQKARIAKTKFFFECREGFMHLLTKEIEALQMKAERQNLIPCVRLNGTSDTDWLRIEYRSKTIFETFPDLQFYDYFKGVITRAIPGSTPNNYDLTWSYSGEPKYINKFLKDKKIPENVRIAAVFTDKLPDKFLGREVVSGDEHDLAFLHPLNVALGLKIKGHKARKTNTAFFVNGVTS